MLRPRGSEDQVSSLGAVFESDSDGDGDSDGDQGCNP